MFPLYISWSNYLVVWLGHWLSNAVVPGTKKLGDFKIDPASHPS